MSSILNVGGKSFRCGCGCNVFHEGDEKGLWVCNACKAEYLDETYQHKKHCDRCGKEYEDNGVDGSNLGSYNLCYDCLMEFENIFMLNNKTYKNIEEPINSSDLNQLSENIFKV